MNILHFLAQDSFIMVSQRCIDVFGFLEASIIGLFAGVSNYTEQTNPEADGWFYVTYDKIETRLKLSDYVAKKPIDNLIKAKILLEKREGIPQRRYFKFDKQKLFDSLSPRNSVTGNQENGGQENDKMGDKESGKSVTGNGVTGKQGAKKLGGNKNISKNIDNNISISSEEDAKKHFSDNDYKSNYKKWWLQKGEKEKLKYRPSSAKLWEEIFKENNPDLYKKTLNSANSDSTVTQSEPIKINNNDPLWLKLSEVLKTDFEKDVYEKWLSKLNFIHLKDGDMLLGTDSKFLRDWIKRDYSKKMLSSFQQAEESLKSINIIYV